MRYLQLTSCLRIGSIAHLGYHGLEGLDRFIVALRTMKRCILQLISMVRRGIEVDGLLVSET